MSIVFRYLTRQVIISMLAVSGILLLVFMSGRFIKYLAEAAAGELAGDVLFQIMAYRFPGFLELILPLGFFIGILLAYGRMYLESEMTVLFACGVSDKQLLMKTLLGSIPVMLVVGAMSLYVSPWGMKKVEGIFNEQRQATEFEMLAPGRFQSLSSGERVTYTEALSEDKRRLEGVFIAEHSEDGKGLTIITAREGSQFIDEQTGSRFLVLEDGARFEGLPGQLAYDVTGFEAYGLKIRSGSAGEKELEEGLATSALMASDDPEHRAMLHWRFTLPLIVPIVTLLAVRLSRVNPRQGRFFHLLPAMLVYITYLGLLIVARDALEGGKVPEWIGLLWVHALFLALGLWLQFGPAWLYRRRLLKEARQHA
ncbi:MULTISPECIES: LPS export ABC transporter permease LptF [Marinobacter]|nr:MULTISPECIES: LPS export ABC transporter permease LptF [Marinobacter]KXJ47833.1 MAG: LPS export ABC transporter permease LptF [Marinobacter sp. Hex_13]MAB52732.1 LPS export ABC transporter permease LptF [Marinobacter sp.]MBS8232619.1 LPS export ABC transporter permease LptF [Marinobacter salarius]MCZ4286696.1 LPS export ABC transporter permease LptF [Marinobacter salarius]MDC8457724.1 LPS export ABC transporter permease LptF [Marinobacter sp. DS40M6]